MGVSSQGRIEDTGSLGKRKSRNRAKGWKAVTEIIYIVMKGAVGHEL